MNDYDKLMQQLYDESPAGQSERIMRELEQEMYGSYSTPDYSNFGIMANTPGPTPDAMLLDDFIMKNNW